MWFGNESEWSERGEVDPRVERGGRRRKEGRKKDRSWLSGSKVSLKSRGCGKGRIDGGECMCKVDSGKGVCCKVMWGMSRDCVEEDVGNSGLD